MDEYIVKSVYTYDEIPCETILTAPLPYEECVVRLDMFRDQYQSSQYVMEKWEPERWTLRTTK